VHNSKEVLRVHNIDRFPDFVSALPEIEIPLPGARGWLIQGKEHQVVFIEFDQDVEIPEHSHAEQWEFTVAGKVVLHREGVSREYRSGDNFFIPAGVPHAGAISAGYKAIIVFNSRDRYKVKK
jgi:quercetin dioxygenase-like cupin family protein